MIQIRPGIILFAFLAISSSRAEEIAPPSISDLIAYGIDDLVEVRWTTHAPTVSAVEFGHGEDLDLRVEEDPSCLRGATNNRRNPGTGFANNHRATLVGIQEWPVHLRIVGKTADGKDFAGGRVTVQRPQSPTDDGKIGRIAISIDRGRWQVKEPVITVGVPLPRGSLADASKLRLIHDDGEVIYQATVVSRYRDGRSIKWLRLSFPVPIGAQQVMLEFGRASALPANPLSVDLSSGATIDTGGGILRVESDGSGLFRSGDISLALPRAVLIDKQGKKHKSVADTVRLEENGPVMAVLRINGHHQAADGTRLFSFEERIHAFAGRPYVRIDYTFGNDRVDERMTSVRSLDLRFEGLDAETARIGTGNETCSLQPGHRVFQREDFEWVAEPGDRKGKRMEGIIRLGRSRILVRQFWEQWPKSIELAGDSIRLGLCPRLPEAFYANRPDEHKLYYHIRDGLHTFRAGLTKTHTLWLDVSGSAESESLLLDEPVASCSPEWIEDSGALRGLAVRHRSKFPGYDEALAQGIARFNSATDSRREYGIMNFGDWFGERRYNWGNLEYDLHHVMFTQFARTGDARFFRIGSDIARHSGDIDTRHYAKNAAQVGQQWTHCMGHTGGYYPATWNNMKIYADRGWSDNRGHIWNRGLLEHYLLGGDQRSWQTGLLISDWAAGPQTTNFEFGNAREPGWMLIIVMAAYNATEDPFYLNAARLMVRKVREKSQATGGLGFYNHRLSRGHCNCETKHFGEAGFMLATLMTGLHMFHEATGDERAADDIVKIVRYIIKTMWVPETKAFRYTSCPKTGPGAGRTWIQSVGFGFAARRSNDPEIIRITFDSLAAAWQSLSVSGKSGGFLHCFAPQGLHEIAQLPGKSFADRQAEVMRILRSPARRWLPTLVPNPDFEENISGWPSRGIETTRDTRIFHSGKASLRIEGRMERANEYVNTTYDTTADPGEIRWLEPGETYRLTAWLRIDRLVEGTPAPSLRLAFRDMGGTRDAEATNTYDTSKLGTWQKLTADITIPKWNTRNYIALNTNSHGPIGGLMYFDDISLVPLRKSVADTYHSIRLDASGAELTGDLKLKKRTMGLGDGLAGTGKATFTFVVPEKGTYHVWCKMDAPKGEAGTLLINKGPKTFSIRGTGEPVWSYLGSRGLNPGRKHLCTVTISSGQAWVGRIVLTTDPGGR